jgi:hypothetical protein
LLQQRRLCVNKSWIFSQKILKNSCAWLLNPVCHWPLNVTFAVVTSSLGKSFCYQNWLKMGLCKCPKRRVTNQFCFEHRVNVCEHCMVQKHPKVIIFTSNFCQIYMYIKKNSCLQCVVQSYLQWLQDSDYNANCPFCDQELTEETCVRLVCYRKFTERRRRLG